MVNKALYILLAARCLMGVRIYGHVTYVSRKLQYRRPNYA